MGHLAVVAWAGGIIFPMFYRLARCCSAVVLLAVFQSLAVASTVTLKSALTSVGAGGVETNVGNLVADAVRVAAGAEIAVIAATEIRTASIPAGEVDAQMLASLMRASEDKTDTIFLLRLSGAQLDQAIERSVSRAPSSYDGFLQVSGLQFTYSPSSAGQKRVEQIKIGGKPLESGQTYTVATTRLLANGALGYFEVWDKSAIARDTAIPVSTALTDFAAARSPLDYHTEGRIQAR